MKIEEINSIHLIFSHVAGSLELQPPSSQTKFVSTLECTILNPTEIQNFELKFFEFKKLN
jgi:hypothetical protein